MANGDKELVGKHLVFFGDFLFSQTTNGGSGLAPTPIAGVGPAGGNTLFIPANNPYNVFDVNFPGPLAARQRTIEIGPRSSINETNTWRMVAGLKGDLTDKFSWEGTFNYSRASLLERILGGVNGANMNAALVPLLDANGNYVYNAKGEPLSTLTDSSGNPLPVYNFFALPGFNDPATLNALRTTLFQSGDTSLRDIQFIFKGTPITLPGGDLSFALGGELRHEALSASVDALFANGLALGYNPANTFAGGSRSSRGAFLEIGVPLVSAAMNIPGIHEADLTLGDRYEQIQPGGNASSPKIGLRLMPLDDSLVLRASFSEGFIAPSIFDLFGPSVGNSPTFEVLEGNGGAGSGGSLGDKVVYQGSTTQLSNPNLQAFGKSKSYTAGIVYFAEVRQGSFPHGRLLQDHPGQGRNARLQLDRQRPGSKWRGLQVRARVSVRGRVVPHLECAEPGHLDQLRTPHGAEQSVGRPVDERHGFRDRLPHPGDGSRGVRLRCAGKPALQLLLPGQSGGALRAIRA